MNRRFVPFWGLMVFLMVVFQPILLLEAQAQGLEIFVSSDGVGTECTQAAPCQPSQGLTNAVDGDTIYFATGTYTGSTTNPILTVTKGVALIGGWDGSGTGEVKVDPETFETIMDGEGVRGLIKINTTDETDYVLVTGFTLSNGYASFGGAIELLDGKADIDNNQIVDNYSLNYGGGIYANASDGLLVRNNVFLRNIARYGGGGIHINRSLEPERAIIEKNVFTENSTGESGYGGAIEVSRSAALINANLIANTNNTSSTILVTSDELVEVTNNIIYWDSYASTNASAIEVWYEAGEETQIINNTIVKAHEGVGDALTAKANITNNIFYSCWKSIEMEDEGNFTGTNNLFYNNQNDPLFLENPVIDDSPRFVNPEYQDYHLRKDSPAVDAGAVVSLDSDYDGDARPFGDGFDIGADEVGVYQNYMPLIMR